MTLEEFGKKYVGRDCCRDVSERAVWYEYHFNIKLHEYLQWVQNQPDLLPGWVAKNNNENYPKIDFLLGNFFLYSGCDYYGVELNKESFDLLDNGKVVSFDCLQAMAFVDIGKELLKLPVYSRYMIDDEVDTDLPKQANDIIVRISLKRNGQGYFSPTFIAAKKGSMVYELHGPRIDWDRMEDESFRFLESRQRLRGFGSTWSPKELEALRADAFNGD